MKKFLTIFTILFVTLFFLTFPLDLSILPNITKFFAKSLGGLNRWTGTHILGLEEKLTYEILSDSTGLYIHVLHLLVFSVLVGVVLSFTLSDKLLKVAKSWSSIAVAYYLSLQLFIYGLNKVFKWQFYLPEPNTLYTTVGDTHLDLLFWSAMGASYPYTVFSGIIEVIPAILLLFRRTRLVGAIIAFAVMVNVVMINFSFDISVKVFSLFLLLLSFILVMPHLKRLVQFFTNNKATSLEFWQPNFSLPKKKNLYVFTKAIVIAVLLFEVFSPYYQSANYNDDLAARPPLHGAYETHRLIIDGDTIPQLVYNDAFLKRVFVHRRGYFITQTATDKVKDYILTYRDNNKLQIENYYNHNNYELTYSLVSDSILYLSGNLDGKLTELMAKKLNNKQLPLLQKEFSWTIDGY